MACLVEANTGYISVNDNKIDNNYLKENYKTIFHIHPKNQCYQRYID